jgi:hypothetical protein
VGQSTGRALVGTWRPENSLTNQSNARACKISHHDNFHFDHEFKSSRRHQRRPVLHLTPSHLYNGKEKPYRWKIHGRSIRGQWLTHDATVDIKSQNRPTLVQEQDRSGKATGRVEDRAGPTSYAEDCRRISIEAHKDVRIFLRQEPLDFVARLGHSIQNPKRHFANTDN